MNWIKATEVPLPIIDNYKRLHVKYNGTPEILVRDTDKWFWLRGKNKTMGFPLKKTSLEAIEWLYEGNETAADDFEYNKQAVKNMSEERDRLFNSEKKLREGLEKIANWEYEPGTTSAMIVTGMENLAKSLLQNHNPHRL